MKSRFHRLTVLLACACIGLMLSGCGTVWAVDNQLTDQGFRPRGKSIAVMSGSREEQSVVIAHLLSEELRKTSKYHVMKTRDLARILKRYPLDIDGPFKSAFFRIDTDWELGDRMKIARIQHALGVDYLYVVWAPTAISAQGGSIYRVPAVAQLFDSSGKVVMQSEMTVLIGDEGNKNLKTGITGIADDIAATTHMSREKRVN